MHLRLPEKLGFLFEPYQYKVAYGGRGSGKSWSFARALLVQGYAEPLRILCTREIQKSIKDSVHRLLADQIKDLGLADFYEVLETVIRGKNGTEFVFAGLQTHTVESIKSYEGMDRVWIEEAHKVSKRSWDVLLPTIRKKGSQVWISFNPELESDETYQRFVLHPPPSSAVAKVNWSDNPWFHETTLPAQREHAQLTDPKGYKNIWEGECLPAVAGAIYFDEIAASEADGRICNVPYDPTLKVHVVFDLGWNDAMAVSLVQKHASELRVIEYYEDSHKTLDHYSSWLKAKNLNWGKMYLPHDGRTRDFKTGKSAEEIMQAFGWEVAITPNMGIEDGIRLTRMTFPRIYFDQHSASRLIQCAKRYRRSINQQTQEPGAPLHDEWSHGADNLRYICVNAEAMSNESWGGSFAQNTAWVV